MINRLFLTLLSLATAAFMLNYNDLSASSRCSERGPAGPRGVAGTNGATGPTGATGAECIFPVEDGAALTFTIFPFDNVTGTGTWHAFIVDPHDNHVGNTGPISVASPPASVVVDVGPPAIEGLYTITFYLDDTQTTNKFLVGANPAIIVTNTAIAGETIVDTPGSINPLAIEVKNQGDNFQLFYNPFATTN